jgi:arylsulfatase A-like enzyme
MSLTRRQFMAASATAVSALAAPKQPNVLIFMSDQESALLPGPVERPNLRRLENGGVRFTHAFCNTPQCSAARSSLLTGLEPHRTGVLTNVDGSSLGKGLPATIPTIGHMFRKAGYSTGYFGKWHLGNEAAALDAFGFDTRGKGGNDDKVAAEAAAWIRGQKGPWLAWVSVLNPHHIYELEDIATRPGVKPPSSGLDNLASKPREQMEFVEKDQGKQTRDYKPADWLRYRSWYLHLLEKVDANLGAVLSAVGDLDSTVIAYTSDHGDALGEHGLPFKGPFMYEEEIRIPMVVRAPWALPGGVKDDLMTSADLAPLVTKLAGVEWTGPKPPAQPRDAVLLEYYAKQKWVNPIRTIRTRQWKFNWYDRGNKELYDIVKDPHELTNLAGTPAVRDIQAKLEARLTAWRGPMTK